MNRLRELFGRLVLTKHESMALIAVFGLYAVGFGWRHLQKTSLPPPSVFLAMADSVADANALSVAATAQTAPADTVPKPKKEKVDSTETRAMETGRLNVNLATVRQLTLLPGIGPALAGRIIEFRESRGPFKTVSDLQDVKGIGPKTLARFEGMIVVD